MSASCTAASGHISLLTPHLLAGVLITRTDLDSFDSILGSALLDLQDLLARSPVSDPHGGHGRARSRDVLHSIVVITLYTAGSSAAPGGCEACNS